MSASQALIIGLIIGGAGSSGGTSVSPTATKTATAKAQPAATATVTAKAGPAATKTVTVEKTVAAQAPKEKATQDTAKTIDDGSWLVGTGKDMLPGKYRTVGNAEDFGGLCLAQTTDKDGNILEQKVSDKGRTIISVTAKADVFESSSCGAWEKVGLSG